MTSKEGFIPKGETLRRPVQLVKKRSGPLQDALNELNRIESADGTNKKRITQDKLDPSTLPASETSDQISGTGFGRRRPMMREKEKKRERWLLTRKTWKYMTDAGRKLLPEGNQNRKEDIPSIEDHFQQVCASEIRFVLWRRKLSYPGAIRNSKPRLKHLIHRSRHVQSPSAIEQEAANNACQTMELLQSYLKLDERFKMTTLLGSKTIRPDQTASPSAQRPVRGPRQSQTKTNVSLRGPGFISTTKTKVAELHLSETEQLLISLTQSAQLGNLPIRAENISPAILEDKVLLKQLYNTLKKQQLHRILSKHSALPSKPKSNLTHTVSLSSLNYFGANPKGVSVSGSDFNENKKKDLISAKVHPNHLHHCISENISPSSRAENDTSKKRKKTPPTTLDLLFSSQEAIRPDLPSRLKGHIGAGKLFNSCGTQTNFIQLSEIKRLAEEYKSRWREDMHNQDGRIGTPTATDDEAENSTTQSISIEPHHRRKSSIDNEDVSQSVSDTIKRYLRMARKKSIHDNDQSNRFKRVNYDRNLRNIRAKGEINPPGMDEGLSKAVQTLDAWPLITLNFIRGNESTGLLKSAHGEWQKILDERIQKKLEYEKQLELQLENNDKTDILNTHVLLNKQSESSCSSSSAPTSPTSYDRYSPNVSTSPTSPQVEALAMRSNTSGGKFLSRSHFLSNLWHGNTSSTSINQQHGRNERTFHSDSDKNGQSNMQKSKSSSNVGQFVTKKILRSRSKSQTRSTTLSTSKWAPCDNYMWSSDNGGTIQIMDTSLHKLSNLEAKLLQRVALEKINELNIGVNLEIDSKTQKRRILPKKKAITTSFFDIGKKDDQNARFNIFGNSLDGCLENDRKRYSNLTATRERGSRTSLISLFRGSSSVGSSNTCTSKLNENVRSCESLPSGTVESPSKTTSATISKSTSGYFSNLKKVASAQISRSQSDMRRKSQEFEINFNLSDTTRTGAINEFIKSSDSNLQVPTFVTSCIKYLEENGLQKIGLFRVSTSQKRVKQMREIFDKNSTSSIEPNTCAHDVATLLKEFLRDLPEPLLCNHLYQAFLKTQKIRNRRLQLEGISHLIKLLPPTHRDTLYILLKFLAKVAAKSNDVISNDGNIQVTGNKMDSNNLATVFAPNILRNSRKSNEGSTIEKESMNDAINVIRIMIDHYEELFKVPAELVDVVYSHMLDECPENLFLLFEQRNETIKSSDIEDELVPEKPARRLYTRESVMHQNDASKSTDMITNGSKVSKRQTESVLNPNVQTLISNNYYEPSGLLQGTLSDSRQKSPPICLDKHDGESNRAGVLSASLQITVPKQIANMSLATATYDMDNLDDVFLDVPQSLLSNEAENLRDSMSKPLQNSDKTQPQLIQKNAKTKTFRSQGSSHIQTNTNQGKTSIDVLVANADKQGGENHSQKKSIVMEPKKPAIISNIGGVILRSKTADFEKMASKSHSSRPQILMQDSIAADAVTATSLTLTVQAKSASSNNGMKQHLYKRQQLIPSAKRNVTTPPTKQK